MDNTQREFYTNWGEEELKVECARLNRVLQNILEILDDESIRLAEE